MRGCRLYLLAVTFFLGTVFVQTAGAGQVIDFSPLQAVVVTTENWGSPRAALQRYERKDTASPWRPVGGEIKAVVGRGGLGWGRGLHPDVPDDHPVKREGDGRAPAGIFQLGASFGYARADNVSWIRIPYRQSRAGDRCVDDVSSSFYNRIVDTSEVVKNWKSDEEMLRKDDQYRLGIFIGHNTNPVRAGKGSCIFFHIWKKEGQGTSGCTAVSQESIEALLRWLDPAASPLLIQMPRGEYLRLKEEWHLP